METFKKVLALSEPDCEILKAILLKPLFSLKLELKEELIFSEAYLDAVVKKALTLNTGATSLDEIVEESTENGSM